MQWLFRFLNNGTIFTPRNSFLYPEISTGFHIPKNFVISSDFSLRSRIIRERVSERASEHAALNAGHQKRAATKWHWIEARERRFPREKRRWKAERRGSSADLSVEYRFDRNTLEGGGREREREGKRAEKEKRKEKDFFSRQHVAQLVLSCNARASRKGPQVASYPIRFTLSATFLFVSRRARWAALIP